MTKKYQITRNVIAEYLKEVNESSKQQAWEEGQSLSGFWSWEEGQSLSGFWSWLVEQADDEESED